MAGMDFHGKAHGSVEAKAMLRHNSKEERLKTKNHSNEHIDKSKTPDNVSYLGLSYKDACVKYDKRVKDLNSGLKKKPRKDQVTMLSIEAKCPKNLLQSKKGDWFRRVTEVTMEWAGGKDNFIESYWHVDEVHEYMDARTGEFVQSREQAHIDVIPEMNGRLCCKEFSALARINDLNNRVEEMTQAEFGVHFMTGEKKKTGNKDKDKDVKKWETVEALKDASRVQIKEFIEKIYEKKESLDVTERGLERRKKQMRSEQAKVVSLLKKYLKNEGVEVPRRATFEDWVQLYEEATTEREEDLQRREKAVQERHEKQVQDREAIQKQWEMIDQERVNIDREVTRRVDERLKAKERREQAMKEIDKKYSNSRADRTEEAFGYLSK